MADNEHSSERRERFTPSKISRLHRRQLFHWIGSDLRTRGKLTNSDRETYVKYLCNSLGQGLWLKVPRKPDALLDGDHFKVTQPVCCFTETSLDEVDDHSRKYGRLGLGFPGRFVLERGGRPVNYLQDKKNDSSVQSWVRLAETFRKPEVLASLTKKERQDVEESLSFVSHFLKCDEAGAAEKGLGQQVPIPSEEEEG